MHLVIYQDNFKEMYCYIFKEDIKSTLTEKL